jgi:hypothetical protein
MVCFPPLSIEAIAISARMTQLLVDWFLETIQYEFMRL